MTSVLKDLASQTIEAFKSFPMTETNGISSIVPPPPPPRPPPLQTRKAACTHLTVSRLYGGLTCSHCGKQSDFGWVYRCTQDYNGELPPWEGGPVQNFAEVEPNGIGGDGVSLSFETVNDPKDCRQEVDSTKAPTGLKPWMEKAISEGQYTTDQIALMRHQRDTVEAKIKESEASIQYHNSLSKRSSGSRRFSHRHTIIDGFGISIPVFPENEEAQSSPSITLKMFPDCAYRSCQSCR